MEKKTKLSISGSPKKTIKSIEIAKTHGKNSRVIEKKQIKLSSRAGFISSGLNKLKNSSSFNRGAPVKSTFNPKLSRATNDFERRKLA